MTVAAVALLAAMVASVTLGPQLAVWPSAPALIGLALSALLVVFSPPHLPRSVVITGGALVAWLAWRCCSSPVAEFAIADGMLLASCVAIFWVGRAVFSRPAAVEILFTGLGVLVIANWIPMALQAKDASHVLWLPRGTEIFPSGFFAYYGDCAAFLLAVALLSGGLAWDPRRTGWFRAFMVIVAMAAAAGVVFTKSRGGIVGLGAGGLLLLVLAPWLTQRRGSRALGLLVILLPILVVGAMIWIGQGMSEAQAARSRDGVPEQLFDNPARLFWLKLAASCIAIHPWQGGGGRSFSWENFRFWEGDWAKFSDVEPEFVHNEFLQITTDYGAVGLLLAVIFIGAVVVAGIIGRWDRRDASGLSAVFLGGLAATAGLLLHACFHFVFHLPPAVLMLGLALAAILETSGPVDRLPSKLEIGCKGLIPAVCAGVLGYFGIKGARVFREMAPVVYRFTAERPSQEDALARMARATGIWPGHVLPLQLGQFSMLGAAGSGGESRQLLLEGAVEAFREAVLRHPFDAEASVNLANALSSLSADDEAEAEYDRAIGLQGGLERGFRARYSASVHHFRKAERLREEGQLDASLESLEKAAALFDQDTSARAGEYGSAGQQYRISLACFLGPWLEGLERFEDAAAEYDRAVVIPGSECLPFLIARNLTAWGDKLWSERKPEAALEKYLAAVSRANQAKSLAFPAYPVSEVEELQARIVAKINFLRGAGIETGDSGP